MVNYLVTVRSGCRQRADPLVEANQAVKIGSIVAKNGPIFAIQCDDFNVINAFVYHRCSLAGVHLVRDRREGKISIRRKLGSR